MKVFPLMVIDLNPPIHPKDQSFILLVVQSVTHVSPIVGFLSFLLVIKFSFSNGLRAKKGLSQLSRDHFFTPLDSLYINESNPEESSEFKNEQFSYASHLC